MDKVIEEMGGAFLELLAGGAVVALLFMALSYATSF